MKGFDKHFQDLTRGIEDHRFKHYNNAMGKMIYSKAHYLHEMKAGGYVPVDMAEEMSEKWEKDNKSKPYELSKQGRDLIKHFKGCARNGMIKLGEYPEAVKELESLGMSFDTEKLEEMVK